MPVDSADSIARDSLGWRIREARLAAEISQTALAQAAGVTLQAVWRYEHNKMVPSADKLGLIASALNRRMEYLLTGAGDAAPAANAGAR